MPTISPGATWMLTFRTGTEPPGNDTVSSSRASTAPVGAAVTAVAGTSSAGGAAGSTDGIGTSIRSERVHLVTLPPAAFASTSPKSVNVSAATVIASAGPSATIGVTKRRESPSLSMRPQSYCGGCTPSPRKLSPASASSASPAAMVIVIRRGSATFGRMCRRSNRTRPTPSMRAAARYSEPATDDASVWLRRAKYGATATPMPTTAPFAPTPITAATKIATSSAGNATVRLMNPVTSRPTRPPTSAGTAPSGMPINAPRPAARMASVTDSRVATSTR